MSKIFFSTRVTDNFFTPKEINKIKEELNQHKTKSEFIRQIIKFYLNNKDKEINKVDNTELKELIKENNLLLQEMKRGGYGFKVEDVTETYKGEEQEIKTEKVLNLLNEF